MLVCFSYIVYPYVIQDKHEKLSAYCIPNSRYIDDQKLCFCLWHYIFLFSSEFNIQKQLYMMMTVMPAWCIDGIIVCVSHDGFVFYGC